MNFRFFTYKDWDEWILLAAIEEYGTFIRNDGKIYNDRFEKTFGINWRKATDNRFKDYNEITLSEAINLINPVGRKNVLKFLKISDSEKIPTQDEQNKIISTLKNSRAFNADSALQLDDINSCLYLVQNNIIKECDFKFFVDKDIQISIQSSLPLQDI